jgi:hypothetical protein
MGLTETDKKKRAPREKEQPRRTRVHRSIYLEQTTYERLGEAYKATGHELYPLEVRKSAFMEVCIAYALDHLSDIEAILRRDVQRR